MILVDTSVWINYFSGHEGTLALNQLIDTNNVCINDLILAELIPSIRHLREHELGDLLYSIHKLNLVIDWNRIIHMQTENLRQGLNKVGIPDLVIAQNAIDHDVELFTLDKHFSLMSGINGLKLFEPPGFQ
jgi:predicted nucleic acid-binding protein